MSNFSKVSLAILVGLLTIIFFVAPAPTKEEIAAREAKEKQAIALEQQTEAAEQAKEKITKTQAPATEWQTIDKYQVKNQLVKDTTTGLMWMRCSLGQKWNGTTCEGDATLYSFKEFSKLKKNKYEGYKDWRIPTIDELKILVHCENGYLYTHSFNNTFNCVTNDNRIPEITNYDDMTGKVEFEKIDIIDFVRPTIIQDVFPKTPRVAYWSSTPFVTMDTGEALNDTKKGINFDNGGDTIVGEQAVGYKNAAVRLVRGRNVDKSEQQSEIENNSQNFELPPVNTNELDEANNRINAVWKGTTKAIRKSLLQEQRAWLKQRENDCSFQEDKIHCMAEMTDQRTEELKQKIALMKVMPQQEKQPENQNNTVDVLIGKETKLNDDCRGGSGDDPQTMKACEKRDAIVEELAKKGWCYGHEGQIGAEKIWEKCK